MKGLCPNPHPRAENKGHVAAVGFLLTPSPEIALEGRENRKFEFEYYSTHVFILNCPLFCLQREGVTIPCSPILRIALRDRK